MMKAALLSLLSILLLPAAFAANGVERGSEAEVPAPAFTPFTPLMQEFIALEVERRCDLSSPLGNLAVGEIRPRKLKYAGEQLIVSAMVEIQAPGASSAEVAVTAIEEFKNHAPRILNIDHDRCRN